MQTRIARASNRLPSAFLEPSGSCHAIAAVYSEAAATRVPRVERSARDCIHRSLSFVHYPLKGVNDTHQEGCFRSSLALISDDSGTPPPKAKVSDWGTIYHNDEMKLQRAKPVGDRSVRPASLPVSITNRRSSPLSITGCSSSYMAALLPFRAALKLRLRQKKRPRRFEPESMRSMVAWTRNHRQFMVIVSV